MGKDEPESFLASIPIGQAGRVEGSAVTRSRSVGLALQAMAIVASLMACVASGLVLAVAAVVGGAALDGYPPEYYDAGNRFAFAVGFLLLSLVCPTTCLVGYALGRWMGWPRLLSVVTGQLAAAVPAGLMFAILAGAV